MNRNRLIAGLAALAIVCILILIGLGNVWFSWINKPSQTSNRPLVSELTYCNSNDHKPCIVSFSLDLGNNTLLVNILTPAGFFPDFYLMISNANEENKYECRPVEDFPNNAYCTGKEMNPGEILHFTLISTGSKQVLAEGNFAIIGLMLVTPIVTVTETAEPAITEAPVETPTPFLLNILTPPGTEPSPSYPNPSYP